MEGHIRELNSNTSFLSLLLLGIGIYASFRQLLSSKTLDQFSQAQ